MPSTKKDDALQRRIVTTGANALQVLAGAARAHQHRADGPALQVHGGATLALQVLGTVVPALQVQHAEPCASKVRIPRTKSNR